MYIFVNNEDDKNKIIDILRKNSIDCQSISFIDKYPYEEINIINLFDSISNSSTKIQNKIKKTKHTSSVGYFDKYL